MTAQAKGKKDESCAARVKRRFNPELAATPAAKRKDTHTGVPMAAVAAEFIAANAGRREQPKWDSVPPPPLLTYRLGSPAHVIGVDIETSDFDPNETKRGRIGQYGWYTTKEPGVIESTRMVEIGWAIGPADASARVEVKSRFVVPSGFEVSQRIESWSGGKITNAIAMEKGVPLAEALREFMTDVLHWHAQGGCVVAHQLDGYSTIMGGIRCRQGSAPLPPLILPFY